MKVLITSCDRFDLLQQTIRSLVTNQKYPLMEIVIHEDGTKGNNVPRIFHGNIPLTVKYTNGIGQHASIEKFLKENKDEKFYLHCEDDWVFDNSYDWIKDSIELMEHETNIIKVLCRKDSMHPCTHDKMYNGIKYGKLKKWRTTCDWYGFSWNPGVTSLESLIQFMPFRKQEQDVVEDVFKGGYETVELQKKVYSHIGYTRSTHE